MSSEHPEPARGEIRDRWLRCEDCGGDVEIEARIHHADEVATTYRCEDCGGVGVQRVRPDESARYCRVETELDGVRTERAAWRSGRDDPWTHREGVNVTE